MITNRFYRNIGYCDTRFGLLATVFYRKTIPGRAKQRSRAMVRAHPRHGSCRTNHSQTLYLSAGKLCALPFGRQALRLCVPFLMRLPSPPLREKMLRAPARLIPHPRPLAKGEGCPCGDLLIHSGIFVVEGRLRHGHPGSQAKESKPSCLRAFVAKKQPLRLQGTK